MKYPELKELKDMQMLCTTQTGMFSSNDKPDKIAELLKDKYYRTSGCVCEIFSSVPLSALKDKSVVVVSSHIDTHPNIKNPHVQISTDGNILRGTFDNSATNAALIKSMLTEDFPDDVVFAFTGDEESGKMTGAKEVISILEDNDITIEAPVALDVTYEGTDSKIGILAVAFTVENCKGKNLEDYVIAADKISDDNAVSYRVATPDGRRPKFVNKANMGSRSWCDEAWIYKSALQNKNAVSFCLPVFNGNMHSDNGVYMMFDTYIDYTKCLGDFIKAVEKTKINEQHIENNLFR